eukprot:1154087-Pyramimonas_sp.AAC.1
MFRLRHLIFPLPTTHLTLVRVVLDRGLRTALALSADRTAWADEPRGSTAGVPCASGIRQSSIAPSP